MRVLALGAPARVQRSLSGLGAAVLAALCALHGHAMAQPPVRRAVPPPARRAVVQRPSRDATVETEAATSEPAGPEAAPGIGRRVTEMLLTPRDAARWRAILPASRSVFGSVEFAQIQERCQGLVPRLFAVQAGGATMAYPFALRPVRGLPFAGPETAGLWDTVSPEFTGPLATAGLAEPPAREFAEAFAAYCRSAGIVAEFAHLHPWHAQEAALNPEGLCFDREIVFVDLTLSEEEIWKRSLSKSCRRNVHWARTAGVRVSWAASRAEIEEFHRIYLLTMDRRQALRKYYLPLEYFLAFHELLPDHARFGLAEHEGRVIAATLFLHDDHDAYGYLGGADHAFQHLCPTNLLDYECLLWSQAHGKRRFVLGGGYRPNDGVFRFKCSFSPLRANFRVYKQVHLPAEYAALCRAWSAHHGPQVEPGRFFPEYRALPGTPGAES